MIGRSPGVFAEAAHVRTLPYVLCEYVHAMGTGPGAIEEYVAAKEARSHAERVERRSARTRRAS